MKVLDLIRYICLHPEYNLIVFDVEDEYTPMGAILHLASIDPSHYESLFFKINNSLEKDTLLVITT
jgi:hypothetical protein